MMALAVKMHARAIRDRLPEDHEMVTSANALNEAATKRFGGIYPELSACDFVDAWIRAYAAWRIHTGED
jgi:hypothetical protein